MAVITKPSRTRKLSLSDGPRPLTRREIESLRQDARETHEWAQKELDRMGIKPLK